MKKRNIVTVKNREQLRTIDATYHTLFLSFTCRLRLREFLNISVLDKRDTL